MVCPARSWIMTLGEDLLCRQITSWLSSCSSSWKSLLKHQPVLGCLQNTSLCPAGRAGGLVSQTRCTISLISLSLPFCPVHKVQSLYCVCSDGCGASRAKSWSNPAWGSRIPFHTVCFPSVLGSTRRGKPLPGLMPPKATVTPAPLRSALNAVHSPGQGPLTRLFSTEGHTPLYSSFLCSAAYLPVFCSRLWAVGK